MRPKAEWVIDSEAMRARGIIVLVLASTDPTSWSKISRIKKLSLLKLDSNPFLPPKSPRFSLLLSGL